MIYTPYCVHTSNIVYHNVLGGAPFDRLTGTEWVEWRRRSISASSFLGGRRSVFFMHMPREGIGNGFEIFDMLSLDNIFIGNIYHSRPVEILQSWR